MGKGSETFIVISDDECDSVCRQKDDSVIIINDSDSEGSTSPENTEHGDAKKDENTSSIVNRNADKRKRVDEGIEHHQPPNHKRVKYGRSNTDKPREQCHLSTGETSDSCDPDRNNVRATERVVFWDEDNTPGSSSTSESVPRGGNLDCSDEEAKDIFFCPVCPRVSFTATKKKSVLRRFNKHFKRTHLSQYYTCRKCNVEFDGRGAHRHYTESNHLVPCPFCGPKDNLLPVCQLYSHFWECHKAIGEATPRAKNCPKCGKENKNVADNITHFLVKHEFEKTTLQRFSCRQCGQTGLALQLAQVHYIKDHHAIPVGKAFEVLKKTFGRRWPLGEVETAPPLLNVPNSRDQRLQLTTRDVESDLVRDTGSTSGQSSSDKGKQPLIEKSQNSNESRVENENQANEQTSSIPCGSLKNLSKFSHIVFVDLDNWAKFFDLPYPLPNDVFVWGFCGGKFAWKERVCRSPQYQRLVQEKRFFQHPKCGKSKNAADFALCVQAARLDLQLPTNIPFTVLSGDKGFGELQNQLSSSVRPIHLVDPHCKDLQLLTALLTSIGET